MLAVVGIIVANAGLPAWWGATSAFYGLTGKVPGPLGMDFQFGLIGLAALAGAAFVLVAAWAVLKGRAWAWPSAVAIMAVATSVAAYVLAVHLLTGSPPWQPVATALVLTLEAWGLAVLLTQRVRAFFPGGMWRPA